jgi:rSAM/selenodomain-associated transferase 2/rSAM/selenodomain-associated transferase 1
LIPNLGEEGAASLHQRMTEHTLNWAKSLAEKNPGLLEIRFEGGSPPLMREWLGFDREYEPQGEGDLGIKMAVAFQDNFQKDIKRIVLVGTDCPQLTSFHAEMAFQALRKHDLVLVPTYDGGYSLIGLRRMEAALFESMEWGTDSVCDVTVERAQERGLSVRVLRPLHDVDHPGDLPVWDRISNQFLSIIVPAWNEAEYLSQTLEFLGQDEHSEVIVVDGGSTDNTLQIADQSGAKVISSAPNRGRQMNLGAQEASGDILLFVHADTLLPENYARYVRQALSSPDAAGGAFAWKISPPAPFLRITEKTANWRTKFFRLPYGDQGIFVRSSLFHELGGYADIPIMEDYEFVRRLRKVGKLVIIPNPVITSSRRYKELGPFQTTLLNKLMILGYSLKISPEKLARVYYKKRRSRRVEGKR